VVAHGRHVGGTGGKEGKRHVQIRLFFSFAFPYCLQEPLWKFVAAGTPSAYQYWVRTNTDGRMHYLSRVQTGCKHRECVNFKRRVHTFAVNSLRSYNTLLHERLNNEKSNTSSRLFLFFSKQFFKFHKQKYQITGGLSCYYFLVPPFKFDYSNWFQWFHKRRIAIALYVAPVAVLFSFIPRYTTIQIMTSVTNKIWPSTFVSLLPWFALNYG